MYSFNIRKRVRVLSNEQTPTSVIYVNETKTNAFTSVFVFLSNLLKLLMLP